MLTKQKTFDFDCAVQVAAAVRPVAEGCLGRDADRSDEVAISVCWQLMEWIQLPACQSLLERQSWRLYAGLIAERLVRCLHGVDEYQILDDVSDFIDGLASEAVDADGEPVFSRLDQEAVHLRYRLGLTVEEMAHILEMDIDSTADAVHAAMRKLGDELQKWI